MTRQKQARQGLQGRKRLSVGAAGVGGAQFLAHARVLKCQLPGRLLVVGLRARCEPVL